MEEEKKNVESQDKIAISKVANAVVNTQMTPQEIEEKIDKALKVCYKLIEDKADNYIPINADSSKKSRLIADLKSNAKVDMFNRVLAEGVDNLEGLTQDIAIDAVKPIVPVEDKGERPISKSDRRQQRLNEIVINDFESLFGDDNSKPSGLIETALKGYFDLTEASKDVRNKVRGSLDEFTKKAYDEAKSDEEKMAIKSIAEAELLYKDDETKKQTAKWRNICIALSQGKNEYAVKLAEKYEVDIDYKIDENGNIVVDKDMAMNEYTKEFLIASGIELSEENIKMAQESECTYENLLMQNGISVEHSSQELPKDGEELENNVEKGYRQDIFFELILHAGNNFEKNATEWIAGNIKSAQKFIKDFERNNDADHNIKEKVSRLNDIKNNMLKERINESLTKNQTPVEYIGIDLQTSQDLLIEMINEKNPERNNQIMLMQNGIKHAEKEKLKKAFLKDSGTFKETITDLVKLNPAVAQEFLKDFMSNSENSSIKNYDFKVMTLQESISQSQSTKETKEENKVLNGENADLATLIDDNGPKLTDDKSNKKAHEDDDLIL